MSKLNMQKILVFISVLEINIGLGGTNHGVRE